MFAIYISQSKCRSDYNAESHLKVLLIALAIYCTINGHFSAKIWLFTSASIALFTWDVFCARVTNKTNTIKYKKNILTCNQIKYLIMYSCPHHLSNNMQNHQYLKHKLFHLFKNLLRLLTWTHNCSQFLWAESSADIFQDFFLICKQKNVNNYWKT